MGWTMASTTRRNLPVKNEPNWVGPGLSPEPPTAPCMRVRTGRFTSDSETEPIDL